MDNVQRSGRELQALQWSQTLWPVSIVQELHEDFMESAPLADPTDVAGDPCHFSPHQGLATSKLEKKDSTCNLAGSLPFKLHLKKFEYDFAALLEIMEGRGGLVG